MTIRRCLLFTLVAAVALLLAPPAASGPQRAESTVAEVPPGDLHAASAQTPPQNPTRQQPSPPAPPPPPPPPAPAKPAPPERGQPVNIQVDVTVQSQGGGGESISKTITMIVVDRGNTSLRVPPGAGPGPRVNGDVRATIRDMKIDLTLNLDLDIREESSANIRYGGITNVHLESGKSMIISKAPDAASGRTLTVEVKATVLK